MCCPALCFALNSVALCAAGMCSRYVQQVSLSHSVSVFICACGHAVVCKGRSMFVCRFLGKCPLLLGKKSCVPMCLRT